jgi:hypothetical protein
MSTDVRGSAQSKRTSIKNENLNLKFERRFPFYEKYNGGLLSEDGKKIYFLAVIDIFTQYG